MRTHIKGEEHARTHAKRRGREASVHIVIGLQAQTAINKTINNNHNNNKRNNNSNNSNNSNNNNKRRQ